MASSALFSLQNASSPLSNFFDSPTSRQRLHHHQSLAVVAIRNRQRHQRHSLLGVSIRNSSRSLGSSVRKSGGTLRGFSSFRVSSDFCGLKKMSTNEGLQKRVRDPQLDAGEEKNPVPKTRNYVMAQMAKPGVKSLAVFVGVPLLLGSINALFNSPNSQWFADLKKPWWEPPGPIFGGAWSILYPLMGLASWLVWAEGGLHKQGVPLTLYLVQLVLNLLWPMFFFGWKNLGLALIDILILDGVLAATVNAFQPVNYVAANLMKPYLAWVLFATALNFNLWLNNRGGTQQTAQ
ncbi:unnamed protein product [Calypogeia fissa]